MTISTSGINTAGMTKIKYQDSTRPDKLAEVESIRAVGSATEAAAKREAHATGKEDEQEYNPVISKEREERQIKNAVDHANSSIKKINKTACEFTYHEDTKRVSIKVVDSATREVIREIPSEETLELIAKLWDLSGMLVDEKR